MKFALYQPWIYLYGGLERLLLELVTRSRHEWVVYTGHYEPENTFGGFAQVDVRQVGSTSVDRSMGQVLRSALQVAAVKLPLEPDVAGTVVLCDGIGDLITFRNASRPLFNICCTPLRPVFDPVYAAQALAQRSAPARLAFRALRTLYRQVDRAAWRRYRGVFATSSEVRGRILAGGLHDGDDSMVMAYPGVDWHEQIDVSYEPMILLPGRIMWTKNIQQGIRAFLDAELPPPWRLVVAGFVDRKSESYLRELQELAGGHARVEFVVSPSDEQLLELYRRASFCLFTPLNEDWGIVPLESMAHAKPVVANARGGPSESVIPGQTGLLLEPDDQAGWAQALRSLAADPDWVAAMGRQGHAHVRRFSWDEFVRVVDEHLEEWAGNPAPAAVRAADGAAA